MTMLDEARPGMDPDVRPQDDLFGHVNGRWLDTEEIPSDRSSWGAASLLNELSETRVRAIVEECAAQADDSEHGSPTQQIGHLWRSFMDEDRIEALGADPVRDDLRRVAETTDHTELAALIGELERTGGNGFFGAYVDTDDRDSDRYVVNLMQGGLGLPDESYYREDKFADVRTAYQAFLTRLFDLAGLDNTDARAERVMGLEKRLAKGHWERAETRDVLKAYNLRTFAEVRELCPSFAWQQYADAMGADAQTLAEVVVRQPSFFEHLSTVIDEVAHESWRDWAMVRIIKAAAPYLSGDFVEANFDFYGRTLSGTPQLRDRWKRGVSFVESCVGEAVGQLYAERHFPPSSKAQMDELVANLLEAYRRSITDLDWMTQETKERAFRKLATFRPKIGYPERFRDYSSIDVRPDDLIHNVRAASAFEHDRQLGKIGAPVDRDEWFMLPQTVNAYYNPGTNEICFPAGILQPPFFDPETDPAENYGAIGAVIGHEIGHGFDDQGSEFDERGNLNEWWTEADKSAFKERAEKLVAQYAGFEPRDLPGETINGELTVGENIGDLGGLTIGHKAYLISVEGEGVPESEGLTGTQRLFMSWAYAWRTKRRKELSQQLLTVDPHSPPEFRANIVRNLDEFHTAFATSPGDGLWLAPEDRVRIW